MHIPSTSSLLLYCQLHVQMEMVTMHITDRRECHSSTPGSERRSSKKISDKKEASKKRAKGKRAPQVEPAEPRTVRIIWISTGGGDACAPGVSVLALRYEASQELYVLDPQLSS